MSKKIPFYLFLKRAFILVTLVVLYVSCVGETVTGKARVIAMTDGEVDDRCSMIRMLLYSNDIELLGIVQTNSCFQRKGWSSENWIEKQIDAYEEVYPNLIIHDPEYPTPDYLKSIIYVGDENPDHIVVDHNAPARIPGTACAIDTKDWEDTPGSDRIVEVLLEDDSRPVYLQAWGGGNTAARAFDKLKRDFPDEYENAVSKAIMYNIWYQDGAGNYIEKFHPGVTMVLSHHFSGTWDYGSQFYTFDFVSERLHKNSGPLAALYPQSHISEGDNPSFLYSLGNGLRGHEDPSYGGWGGRFYKVDGFENVYRDIDRGSYMRWIEYGNRDFENRLEWCVQNEYEKANHAPEIEIVGRLDRTVKSGDRVPLIAKVKDDDAFNFTKMWNLYGPIYQQHGVKFEQYIEIAKQQPLFRILWWQFQGPGTYPEIVQIIDSDKEAAHFIAPEVSDPKTIHIILEVKDQGVPALTSFQRVIVTVEP